MYYNLTEVPHESKSECIVLGFFSDDNLHDYAHLLPEQFSALSLVTKNLVFKGDWSWQTGSEGTHLMSIHCGQKNEFNSTQLTTRLNEIIALALKQHITSLTLILPPTANQTPEQQLRQMLLTVDANCYQLTDFKTNHKNKSLTQVEFYLNNASQKTLIMAEAIAAGIQLTKRLADLPANVCTPKYLGQQAQEMAEAHASISTKLFNNNEIAELGMGAFLAVAQGSIEPPCFIEINYQGGGAKKPIVLIGKGVTFDSGGLTLKPGNLMDEMKYDMAGAASVMGTIKACALLNLPLNVIGLIAATENMPSGSAVKPGDIVKSMSGKTIEILNTDAEGRLTLADALTYAERFNPEFVLDIATLTGGVIVALGTCTTGFMTKDEQLAELITLASRESCDASWRLPLDDSYQDALDSPLADMINAGFDRTASSITAACFLSRFAGKFRWAHLDIAGTAWVSGKKRHATGRPVSLLTQLLHYVAHSR